MTSLAELHAKSPAAHPTSTTSPESSALSTIGPISDPPASLQLDPVMCTCCRSKKRCTNTTTCSKRCEWFASGRCPQCGRGRRPDLAFCSKACASHSVHANWCPTCTVRQSMAGKQHCSDECACTSEGVVQRPRKKSDNQGSMLLKPDDRERMPVAAMFTTVEPMGVIQVAANPFRRRQYLNHRAAVEHRMTQQHAPKYGFGGEGNEHKCFMPLRMTCAMHALPDGTVLPCGDHACDVCQVLTSGFSLQRSDMLSHYCMATGDVAASWAEPSPCGLRAVAVVRTVTGHAEMLTPESNIPAEPWSRGFDSCVVSDGNTAFDGTYLYTDDAIEALYLVLFM